MDLDNDLIEKINKIISSMVLTISSAVAEVEQVSVLLRQMETQTLVTIKISNEHKQLSRSLVDKLTKKIAIDLDTKNINIYMTFLLLEHYNAKMDCICENNFLKIALAIT
ncbi:hypothetical protein [Wolbachia endosymbiont (group E) of Neria commutata]|uniref:hypothetical protein n=1 Tax=Wolbachia endosymbiont (group E) of Neria commutata TaxID=3066149 RepID=UPI0031331874